MGCLCSKKSPVKDKPRPQDSKNSPAHEAQPGVGVFRYNPLPPSTEGKKQKEKVSEHEPFPMKFIEYDWKPSPEKLSPNTTYNPLPTSTEGQKQQKKVSEQPPPMKFSESDRKPSPKTFSPNTTYVRSPSPVLNSDSDDTKDKKSKKTSSPDRKLASSDSETTYASNPMNSTDHFPEWNSDSNKPTTIKTGHKSKLSTSPPPEKLNIKSTELSENTTHRFPTSDEVTRNTTGSPTKARDEQNAKASNTSSNNKKLMWNEKEHIESPYKDAAFSLHYQTAISDSERPKYS